MKSLTRDPQEATTQQVNSMPLDTQASVQIAAPEQTRWHPSASAYATDHLFAVVEDSGAARRAAQSLLAGGYSAADVQVYSGPVHARLLEQQEQRRGVVRFFRAVQEAFTYDEHTTRTHYPRALRQGKSLVVVYCPTDADVQQAADLLAREGARHMVYYGRWNIQLVSPLRAVTTGEPRHMR